MKKVILILLVISLIIPFACSKKKNSPTQPEQLSPIPLKVGNWWKYKSDITIDFYTKCLIEDKTIINNKEAFIVGYYMAFTSEVKVTTLAWQWDNDNNLFKEYLIDSTNNFIPFSAVRIPSNLNDQVEWGKYRTIYQENESVMYYSNCDKYLFVRIDTGHNYYKWFKPDIGITKEHDDFLVDYHIQ